MEDMLANMQSHIPKDVFLMTNQTWDLSLPLQNPGLVSWDGAADDEKLLICRDEIKMSHGTRSDAIPLPDQ